MFRLNAKTMRAARLDGRVAKVARLNGRVVWASGLRSLHDEFDAFDHGTWRTACDPADERAYPYVSDGLLRAGVPTGLFSGKPAQSVYTQEEADNEEGEWIVRIGTSSGTAGLYSGVILGTDASAGRMTEVVWDKNGVRFRYRTATTNSWVTLGSTSITLTGSETMRVTRTIESGSPRVRVYENDVLRGNWLDSSNIPGAPGGKFIGVRLQGDRNFFQSLSSTSVAEFTFTST